MNEQTLDLRDYARLIRAQRRTVLIFALIFAVGSLGYSVHKGRTFTASARVVVEPVVSVIASQTNVPNQLLSPNMETESELVKSLAIAQGVRSSLVLQATAEQLVKGVRVSVVSNTDVLVVSYVDRNPATAARLANAFADEYVTQRRNDARLEVQSALQSLQDRLASDEEQLSQLKDQIAASPDANGLGALKAQATVLESDIQLISSKVIDLETTESTIQGGRVVGQATVPTKPNGPSLLFAVLLGALLGGAVGAGFAVARGLAEDKLGSRDDLHEITQAPTIGAIPEVADWGDRETTRVVALEAPRSQAAEAYRTLRTNVLAAAAEHGLQTLAVVSALSGEGKTTTTANLGVVLAQADKRVLVISADMRRPRIHEYFGLEQEEGLSEFLEGMGRPWDSLKRSAIENLWVMASGSVPERPAELLQSATMRELLEEQRRVVDFVLIDCPPVLAVADSLELAPLTDGVIFVADASRTPRGAVIEACAQLDQVGARVIGGILNNVGTGTAGFEYYQKYSYEPLDAPEASSNGKVNLWDTLRKIRS